MSDSAYEVPWRPTYEWWSAASWAASILVALLIQYSTDLPIEPFYWWVGVCGIMCLWCLIEGYPVWRKKARLAGYPLEFITHEELQKRAGAKGDVYLGRGFRWGQQEAQHAYELLTRPLEKLGIPTGNADRPGAPWIHGLGEKEKPIRVPRSMFEGHLGILGTTGAGKTRLFDLLITQAIMRGESVIIIDPKCDHELMANAETACRNAGKANHFAVFHPAKPDRSVRINVLKNFGRASEVASRIAALIPSETGADPFKAFGQRTLDNVIQGLLLVHEVPTLVKLRHYLEGGVDRLVARAVEAYGRKVLPDYPEALSAFKRSNNKINFNTEDGKRKGLSLFYREVIAAEHPHQDLEGLLSMAEHNREHLGKMIASLLPILGMLTSGHMGPLLSPDDNDADDLRPIYDLRALIRSKMVLYVALDSLSDAMVGSAIGSMLLSDLTAVAGDRYNFDPTKEKIFLFVDEAAEVINTGPFVQLLNKGRGAGFTIALATQTISDFVVRTGSKDGALQILGNLNNWLTLRVIDTQTQESFSERLGTTKVRYVMRTQGSSMGDKLATYGGNSGERLMEEEAEVVPPAVLGKLPNLEFFAYLAGGTLYKGRIPILQSKGGADAPH